MRGRLVLFSVLLLMLIGTFPSFGLETYRLGVRAPSGEAVAQAEWHSTIEKLNSLGVGNFVLRPVIGFDEMSVLVGKGELDLVLTQPAEFVKLESRYGLKRILTYLNGYSGLYINRFSSVIFVRADNRAINSLGGIAGRVLAGINPEGFGGYLLGAYELSKAGLEADRDYGTVFTGSQPETVRYVLEGRADAGVVRTGILESMVESGELSMNDIRIINRKYDSFPMPHSAVLVPEWSLAVNSSISDEAASELASAILTDKSMYQPENAARWTVPVDYGNVYDILKVMKKDDYLDSGSGAYSRTAFIAVVILVCLVLMFRIYFR